MKAGSIIVYGKALKAECEYLNENWKAFVIIRSVAKNIGMSLVAIDSVSHYPKLIADPQERITVNSRGKATDFKEVDIVVNLI